MSPKVRIYLASEVFSSLEIGSNPKVNEKFKSNIRELWDTLEDISELKIFNGRFPSQLQLENDIKSFDPDIIGCHLSHEIKKEILEESNVFAIATSTMGYNHIGRIRGDKILITHTPGVLFEAVADFTISLIMVSLRNLIDLHQFVWDGKWTPNEKWDLDQNLCSVIENKELGIVGFGQIGQEVVKKLSHWGIKINYTDIARNMEEEKNYPNLNFCEDIKDIFSKSDIISIHIPLNNKTKGLINRPLLKLMKKDSLLINTARGPIINIYDLLELLEKREISLNLAFDVFGPSEPIEPAILERFKKIKELQPNLRFLFIPHNASADADTRAKMNIMFLSDIITIVKSKIEEDLKDIHIIPEQKHKLNELELRIKKYWGD